MEVPGVFEYMRNAALPYRQAHLTIQTTMQMSARLTH